MVVVSACSRLSTFFPARTRGRILSLLIVVFIAVQISWHHRSYYSLCSNASSYSKLKAKDNGSSPETARNYMPSVTFVGQLRRKKVTNGTRILQPGYEQIINKTRVLQPHYEQAIDKTRVSQNGSKLLKSFPNSLHSDSKIINDSTKLLEEGSGGSVRRTCPELSDIKRSVLYSDILHNFTLKINDTKDGFVNLHRYGHILNSDACRHTTPDVLVLVHSKYDHFGRREEIRSSWAFNKTFKGVTFKTVFFLGHPNLKVPSRKIGNKMPKKQELLMQADENPKIAALAKRIYNEARLFGDIVMGNFTDSYRNLTIKHVMALNWVMSHCRKVKYIVKVDDDVILNTYSIINYIRQTSTKKSGLLVCRMPMFNRVQRRKGDKWSVSMDEYSFSLYPNWCFGYGVLMTRDVVEKLLQASRHVRSYWIDDVYVTGLVRCHAGLSITPLPVWPGHPGKSGAMFVLRNFLRNQTFIAFWNHLVSANENWA